MENIYEKLQYDIQIYCLCQTMGSWVKTPTTLKEDTLKWVYGVGPTNGL